MSSGDFCSYLPSNYRRKKAPRNAKKAPPPKGGTSFITKLAPSTGKSGRRKNRQREEVNECPSVLRINAAEYTILHIDIKIRAYLTSKISTISELQKDLHRCIDILTHGDDPAQKIMARKRADELRKKIKDLESTIELMLYIFRTQDMLEEYRKLMRIEKGSSFLRLEPTKYNENESRMNIIEGNYLRIAREYAEIENIEQKAQKMICPDCQGIYFTQSSEEDSIFICQQCFIEIEILDDTPSYKDTDRVNMASKYTYTKKGHFCNAIKRFQGVQNIEPKKIEIAVSVLKEEMMKHNLVSEQGLFNSVTKDHLYMFLSECGLSERYDDLNLLYYIITDVPCPDISEYEDYLYEDFDLLEEAYQKVKEPDRPNSLNVNYKLYKLLQRRGYPCKKEDFYILKTKAKEDEHNEKMKECWDVLEWTWIGD